MEGLFLSKVARDLARQAAAERILALLNSGHLSLYSGDPPKSDDPGRTSHVELAALRFSRQAFGPAPGGKAQANPIAPARALASGKATWFRCWGEDGTSVMRGTVGKPPCDGDPKPVLEVNTTDIEIGATVIIASFGYVQAG